MVGAVRALVDHAADDLTAALAHIEAITQDSPKLAQGKSKGEKPVLAFSGNEHKFRNEQKPSVTSKKTRYKKCISGWYWGLDKYPAQAASWALNP